MSALRLRKTTQRNNPKVETKRDEMVKCLTKKKGEAADTEETHPQAELDQEPVLGQVIGRD